MFEERVSGKYIMTHIYRDGEEMTPSEVVDLLNEQQATINKLKSDIEETEITIKLFEDDVNRLSKENEQLKEKIEMDKNDFCISEVKRMTLLAFIKDNELQKEYYEWERRIYDD